MEKVKFYLVKRRDKEGNLITKGVPIKLSFHFAGNRLEYYTQVQISNTQNFNVDYFDKGKSPIKSNEPEAARKNDRLRKIKKATEDIYDNAIALGLTPSIQYIRTRLDERFKGKTEKEDQLLVKDAFLQFLDFIKKNRSEGTWKKYNTTFDRFQTAYSKEIAKLTFNEINTVWVEDFRKRLIDMGYEEKGEKRAYLNNTLVKYLKSFREFLNWCKDEKRGYYAGNAKFESLQENETDIIYLDKKQIKQFIDAEMPSDTLQRVKDVFLFGCYTGLRYQDLKDLKKVNVKESLIRFYISKGKNTTWHEVPLLPEAQDILAKYKDMNGEQALPVVSNQKMNQYIKEAMKAAGINNIIVKRELKADGTIEDKEYKQWQLITCHIARKSFITRAVESGIDELTIKSISGHSKNSRAFARYYEISAEKKRREMNKMFSGES